MKLTVFSPDGTKSSEQDFAGLPTFDGDRGLQAVKEVIVAINANNRLGTHSTKTRAEVSGGGRKPDRKSTRLNSSHSGISYAVFCLKTNISGAVLETSMYTKCRPSISNERIQC